MSVTASLTSQGAIVENGHIRLELRSENGRLVEQISARSADEWKLILTTADSNGDPRLDLSPKMQRVRIRSRSADTAVLVLEGSAQGVLQRVEISLVRGERSLGYRVTTILPRAISLRSVQAHYKYMPGTVDFCFTPHLRPGADHVIGRFAFKSPAVILQRSSSLAAILPDLTLVEKDGDLPECLDADVDPHSVPLPVFGYGLKGYEPEGLIYFRHKKEKVQRIRQGRLVFGYHLYASANAEPLYGYREITRWLWRTFGRREGAAVRPQVVPLDRYAEYALGYAIPNLWREFPENGKDRGGFLMGIKYPNDIWFHFFFNHLQTAYGLALLGRRWRNADLELKARRIRNLIVSAPIADGLIPAIFSHEIITGMRRDRWIPHAHWVGGAINYQSQVAPPSDQPAYNTSDSAATAYWMLRWHADIERDRRLLAIARACGDKLLRIQLPCGAVPIFVHKDSLEPLNLLRANPSCAYAGVLFAELYAVTREARFLRAAERVAGFLAAEVMPQRWSDYETYFDSAGKPMDLYDPYTQQWPQNTYSMYTTAQLFKALFRLTHAERYLEQAERVIDYLLLFQAVWSPPFMSVSGFGTIGVGNGHTGWNDARSAIFAAGIADFYTVTGRLEYLHRGVIAMRAPLAMMYIPENRAVSSVYDKGPLGYADEGYAHRGRDGRLGPSCFDYGTGYSLTAFAELWSKFGSVFVDLRTGDGVGIDGCSVTGVKAERGRSVIRLKDEVATRRSLDLQLVTPEGKARRVVVVSGGGLITYRTNRTPKTDTPKRRK